MSRGRKLPPLTADDIVKVLRLDGWHQVDGTKHLAYKHPTKPGKVNVDEKWTGVKRGGWVWVSILAQSRLTPREFEALYWRTRGK